MTSEIDRVLFLCTGNSARSLMAEALLRHHAAGKFDAVSAGLVPAEVHPMTLQVLEEIGIDTKALYSKGIDGFLGKVSVQYAVFVCEKAQASCPRLYPFATRSLYWPFEDPAECRGDDLVRLAKFREVRDRIDVRIRTWLEEMASLPSVVRSR